MKYFLNKYWLIVLCIPLVVLFIMASSCNDEDDTQEDAAADPDCMEMCYQFDFCIGFEAVGETFQACEDSCREPLDPVDQCIVNCDPYADCGTWLTCAESC